MHKILIAVDGSEHARKAVSFVADLAAGARLEAILLNVQPEPEIRSMALAREAVVTAEQNDVRVATAAAEAALKAAGVPVSICVEHGDPAPAIARLAEETNCDHIVMGTRGLGSLAGLVMGSVATKVLQLAHVPVTLVK